MNYTKKRPIPKIGKPILLALLLLLSAAVATAVAQSDSNTPTIQFADPETPSADTFEIISQSILPSGVVATEARIYADRATFISYGNPDTNYGNWQDMYFGNQPGGYGAMRLMMRFPVEQIPANAAISSANMNLYLHSVTDNTSRVFNAYLLSGPWSDNGITWNYRPGRSGTIALESNVSSTPGWKVNDVTDLTRNWYSNPGANHGFEVEGEEQPDRTHTRIYKSNNSLDFRPYLSVYYTTGGGRAPDAWITAVEPRVTVGADQWTAANFKVKWAGTDYSGTGIKWYDVYYSTNGGANWTVGRAQTPNTETEGGPAAHDTRIALYVRARDNVGNEGAEPSGSSSSQMNIRIDAIAPVVTVHALPPHTDASGTTIQWGGGTDQGSGIAYYDVEWREAGGVWQPLLSNTTATSQFVSGGQNGTTYEFRARGVDKVGNAQPFGNAQASTTVWLEPTAYIAGFIPENGIYQKLNGPEANDSFKVLWGADSAPNASIVSFSLRYYKPGSTTPIAWHTDLNAATTSDDFDLLTTDPDGIYTFQVKAKDSVGNEGQYRTETQGSIIVDRVAPFMDRILYLPTIKSD